MKAPKPSLTTHWVWSPRCFLAQSSSSFFLKLGSVLGHSSTLAPVFWVCALNGWIIDNYELITAYQMIFGIGLAVSIAGAPCALVLIALKRRIRTDSVEQASLDAA